MRLLTGPAASGKTSRVLEEFRAALGREPGSARLLVPTATMARHLQNRLAREGFILRPSMIQTLSRFVDPWAEELPQISDPCLYLLVEEAARRVNRPEFARVVQLPGFCASLARTVEELSAAGCDAARLARNLPDTPLGEAFLAVFREVDRELARRGLGIRSTRLARAAARIAQDGLGEVRAIWLDGFHTLPDPELLVIDAMRRHARIVITLPSGVATEPSLARLRSMGFREEICQAVRPAPRAELFAAAGIEREADEMARRILEQIAGGRTFREIGIVVRNERAYEPILRATFQRYGIPARFYFDQPLLEHGLARLLSGAVDDLLGGWDWAETLAVLRLRAPLDAFDFTVRACLPGRGLEGLKTLAQGDPRALSLLAHLESLEAWRGLQLPPAEWAVRLRALRTLFEPPGPPEAATHDQTALWRSQAAVLALIDQALDEAARWMSADAIPLAEFWRAAKAVMRLLPLRLEDHRRNVVNVLDVHEARQWQLPVVFVCGLVEGQFPRYQPQDVFFPDAARRRLNDTGLRLRTSLDSEAEERSLFESAMTRATDVLVLSYPRFDQRGEDNLPSLFLESLNLQPDFPAPVEPAPLRARAASRPLVAIRASDLIEKLEQGHRVLQPTALESFLQCPFQFFARYTLRLTEPPPRPENRLDARVQGTIVHRVLAEWHRTREPIEALFGRVFETVCRQQHIPDGYRTESLRQQMLGDLRRFAADSQWPARDATEVEREFEFALDGSVCIHGRLDRLDTTPQGAFVIDYKYSKKAQEIVNDPGRLQGPLYLLAVEKALGLYPAGMLYCGLRGAVKYVGWSAEPLGFKTQTLPPGWLAATGEAVVQKAGEIRAGRIAPEPADPANCRFCAFRDVCRVAAAAESAAAEGGG